MELTPQEIQLFRHNGFIKFPTQLPMDQVEAIKAAALKDMAEVVEPVARQNGRIIRISAIWERGGIFRETITCDEILNPLGIPIGFEYRICVESAQSYLSPRRRFKPFACVASRRQPLVPHNRDCFGLSGGYKFREWLHACCTWIPSSTCFRKS